MESAQAVHNVVHTVGGRETDMYVATYSFNLLIYLIKLFIVAVLSPLYTVQR